MNIGIMQSYFFPYVVYLQLIDSVDVFILYEHVTFRKKSWITRNRIIDRGTNDPIFINVPVRGQSSSKLIKEIQIDNSMDWQKKNLNLIYFNYKKASHFNEIYPFLEKIINHKELNLHKYNSNIIIHLCQLLDIRTKIIFENNDNIEKELKNLDSISLDDIKSERIIKLCNHHKSNTYINPIGGKELYNKEYFKKRDINLFFVETNAFNYKQFDKCFIPYLSIIDILMHSGIEETKSIIKKYQLN